jgi:hypothetical protein
VAGPAAPQFTGFDAPLAGRRVRGLGVVAALPYRRDAFRGIGSVDRWSSLHDRAPLPSREDGTVWLILGLSR